MGMTDFTKWVLILSMGDYDVLRKEACDDSGWKWCGESPTEFPCLALLESRYNMGVADAYFVYIYRAQAAILVGGLCTDRDDSPAFIELDMELTP